LHLQRIGGDILIHGDSTFEGMAAGILIEDSHGVTITGNHFSNISAFSISVSNCGANAPVIVAANVVDNDPGTIGGGFVFNNVGFLDVIDSSLNLVDDGITIYNSGRPGAPVNLEGNEITHATRGFVVDGTGPTILRVAPGNSGHDAVDGLVLRGEHLLLEGNTLGDMAMTLIDSMFCRLEDQALLGLRIDATHVTFDGHVASDYPIAGNFILEDKITHATDDSSVGFIRVYDGKVFVTQSSGSIQRGLDVASAGDTLNVNGGTYSGPFTVFQPTTIIGYAIVTITGGGADLIAPNITIDRLNFQGDGSSSLSNAAAIKIEIGAAGYRILNSHFSGHANEIITAQAPVGSHHGFVSNNLFDLGPTSSGIILRNTHDDVLADNVFHGGSTAIVVAGSN